MHWCSEAICLHYLCKKLPKPKKPRKMFNSFTRQNVVQQVTLSGHIKEFVASFILTSFPIKTSLYFKKNKLHGSLHNSCYKIHFAKNCRTFPI